MTVSTWPQKQAQCSDVSPHESVMFGSAPFLRRTFTTVESPRDIVLCSGVNLIRMCATFSPSSMRVALRVYWSDCDAALARHAYRRTPRPKPWMKRRSVRSGDEDRGGEGSEWIVRRIIPYRGLCVLCVHSVESLHGCGVLLLAGLSPLSVSRSVESLFTCVRGIQKRDAHDLDLKQYYLVNINRMV